MLQHRLAAARKGSKTRQKRKRLLAKEWQRGRERERASRHELTPDGVPKTTGSSVAHLPGQRRMGTPQLARARAEQPWSPVGEMRPSKAARAGGGGVPGDPTDTAQDGSRWGHRVQKALSDRLHACPACGLSMDRDWNAARNIWHRGLVVRPPSGGNSPRVAVGGKNGMRRSSRI